MNNIFMELESDFYVNLNHVVYVDFTEDDILADSVLAISLSDGSEITFSLFEFLDDYSQFILVLDFLNYLKLYKLANTIGSYLHDLHLVKKNY